MGRSGRHFFSPYPVVTQSASSTGAVVVTMSLSRNISEIFSAKQWRDFEIWVRGHSRSFKMVPFEGLYTVSYSHSIATMAVSVAVSSQYTNVTVRLLSIYTDVYSPSFTWLQLTVRQLCKIARCNRKICLAFYWI